MTGPIWATPIWGKPWIWEPRLITTLVLFIIYLYFHVLNVFIYDVTDLDADEITRRQEEYLDIDSYFIKDSHILKTNSPG